MSFSGVWEVFLSARESREGGGATGAERRSRVRREGGVERREGGQAEGWAFPLPTS